MFLYYPPSADNRVSLLRDALLLPVLRLRYKKVIFHFHTGGFAEAYKNGGPIIRFLYKLAYNRPNLAIVLSESLKEEVRYVSPLQVTVIPNGLPDCSNNYAKELSLSKLRILFVSNLHPSKGIEDCIETAKILQNNNINFHWDVLGSTVDLKFEKKNN